MVVTKKSAEKRKCVKRTVPLTQIEPPAIAAGGKKEGCEEGAFSEKAFFYFLCANQSTIFS